MFCSINNFDDKRINTLRDFVLDKNAVGLDKSKYKLCLYLTKSNLMKYAPLSVILRMGETGCEAMALSEITAYPLWYCSCSAPHRPEFSRWMCRKYHTPGLTFSSPVPLPSRMCSEKVN